MGVPGPASFTRLVTGRGTFLASSLGLAGLTACLLGMTAEPATSAPRLSAPRTGRAPARHCRPWGPRVVGTGLPPQGAEPPDLRSPAIGGRRHRESGIGGCEPPLLASPVAVGPWLVPSPHLHLPRALPPRTRPLVPTELQQSRQGGAFLKENSFTKQASLTVDGIASSGWKSWRGGLPGALLALTSHYCTNKPRGARLQSACLIREPQLGGAAARGRAAAWAPRAEGSEASDPAPVGGGLRAGGGPPAPRSFPCHAAPWVSEKWFVGAGGWVAHTTKLEDNILMLIFKAP